MTLNICHIFLEYYNNTFIEHYIYFLFHENWQCYAEIIMLLSKQRFVNNNIITVDLNRIHVFFTNNS